MTKEYQQNMHNTSGGLEHAQEVKDKCQEFLEKALKNVGEQQESVLKAQAELNTHILVCRQIKADLKTSFEAFCAEKFEVLPLEEDITDENNKNTILVSSNNVKSYIN